MPLCSPEYISACISTVSSEAYVKYRYEFHKEFLGETCYPNAPVPPKD